MSIEYYRGMLIQKSRMNAFRQHLHDIVNDGDRVLEIGSGLGTYSFFAAEAGATHITAIEGGSATAVAKSIARANGFDDRVQFIRGWYPRVEAPSQVDVVVFEDYPPRLLDAVTFNILRHLHKNVLTPSTRLVPNRAKIFAAPVHSEKNWRVVGPFGESDDTAYGVDWSECREYIYNTPLQMPLTAEDCRHEPREIAEVSLDRTPDASALVGDAEWEFEFETTIHGLAYWFEFEVGKDVWLSNAPGQDPGSWGNLYLPIPEPLVLRSGDKLRARIAPEVKPDGCPNWLTWEVRCGEWSFTGHEFRSVIASLSDLIPSSSSWVPELSAEGQIERTILDAADGYRSVEEIVELVRPSIPRLSVDDIQSYVVQILRGRTAGEPSAKATRKPYK